ncbi:MAG: hypothetical protein E7407_06030 [Ruminococcaceae bacterium]|nr:hypothetical protein [Oscillospiraceae bacterium]
MIKITRFFYVSIACFPLLLVSYFTGGMHTLFLAYSIAAVHELFHLFAALLLSVRVKSIILMPFGITLRLADSLIKNPVKEAIIAFAGPFANIIMIYIAEIMGKMFIWGGVSLFLFKYVNIIMLVVNLLPCMPLDGGRIFKAFLVHHIGFINAASFQRRAEKIIIVSMGILGTVLLFITKFNISLVMIAAFLAFNMVGEEKRKNYIIMREIMNSWDKLKNVKYMRTKILTARHDIKAGELIKRLGYDSFYIINVSDSSHNQGKLITETELISGIEKFGFNVSLGEISDKAKGLTSR